MNWNVLCVVSDLVFQTRERCLAAYRAVGWLELRNKASVGPKNPNGIRSTHLRVGSQIPNLRELILGYYHVWTASSRVAVFLGNDHDLWCALAIAVVWRR